MIRDVAQASWPVFFITARESLLARYKKNERPRQPDVLERDFVLAAAKVPHYAVPA